MVFCFFWHALIGACLASHAAVVIEHLNDENSFLSRRSQCPFCGCELSLLDEIPIISYLLLHGRCRCCRAKIPASLLATEVIGAISFIKINFFSLNGLLDAIFLFYLLLAALEDRQSKEFSSFFFVPLTLIALFRRLQHFYFWPAEQIFAFLFVFVLLLVFVYQKKMGGGDLWAYLIFALAYEPDFANEIFGLACCFMLLSFLLLKERGSQPFIPYLFLSFACLSLWP